MIESAKKLNKIVDFSFFNQAFFGFAGKTKILVLILNRQTKFFLLPSSICCESISTNLYFYYFDDKSIEVNLFFFSIFNFIQNFSILIKKKLRLHGLGFKLKLSGETTFLTLKLGFSHLIFIPIPKDKIKILIRKNILIVEGLDKVEVGNFVHSVKSLRKLDVYKGKGFVGTYEKEKLKIIKKK
jgi:hypothetical protein